MKYIILSMHKSGSTLVSKTLHDSGINMVDHEVTSGNYIHNKYERKGIHDLIMEYLSVKNLHSTKVIPPFNKKEEILKEFEKKINEYDKKYGNWGFKDPRTIFIYNDIKEILGEHKLIFVYRRAKGTLTHYLRTGTTGNWELGRDAIKAWQLYNEHMISLLQNNHQDYLVINFEVFLENNSYLKKLSRFCNLEIKDVREKDRSKIRAKKEIHYLNKVMIKIFFTMFYLKIKKIENTLDDFC